MSDVSLDVFLPDVMPWVRDCPELVARGALRNAMIEFCNKSQWWLYTHAPLSVIADLNHYEFDLPTDTDIVTLVDVRVDGVSLEPKSFDELDAMFGTDWRTVTGRPRYYTRQDAGELLLVPCPQDSSAQGLTMILALRPARTAEFVDEEFYRRWSEELAYGARARLHEMPGQPFYDLEAANRFRAEFKAAIGIAIAERNRGQTRGPISIRYPRIV